MCHGLTAAPGADGSSVVSYNDTEHVEVVSITAGIDCAAPSTTSTITTTEGDRFVTPTIYHSEESEFYNQLLI